MKSGLVTPLNYLQTGQFGYKVKCSSPAKSTYRTLSLIIINLSKWMMIRDETIWFRYIAVYHMTVSNETTSKKCSCFLFYFLATVKQSGRKWEL